IPDRGLAESVVVGKDERAGVDGGRRGVAVVTGKNERAGAGFGQAAVIRLSNGTGERGETAVIHRDRARAAAEVDGAREREIVRAVDAEIAGDGDVVGEGARTAARGNRAAVHRDHG